ncbi:protein strawberry notch isoform X2 [Sitodiplosis mosellana]|uniref:protein strawberry notch isoform X2 n=1 Tax=Sitodiplosis mosellana TaxID=263140 RepID=UPI0024438370|nr:protein strawberry notch isoform X2 [Sitodiplosis mosellana]
MYEMANTKEMFEDDDLDVSSGSDFDDDEDPDKIEVPGGGRDLATAASFGKQTTQSNPLINSQSNSTAKATTFDLTSNAIGTASNQPQPVLKHLIPAESILKPFLPKVNTASTRVHPPSTTTNITAASNAAMVYTNAAGYGAGIKMQAPPQAFGMRSASAANSSMPMMNAAGLGGLGSVSSSPSLYSINNMAASLLAQMEMGAGGFGGLGGAMGALSGGSMSNPNVVQTYQAMLQNIQKLLAYNPDFLTKGIPNNLLQMCMEQTQKPTMYGQPQLVQPEEDEAEEEEMGVAETYADYWPAKLKLGKKHPDPVVETASLSSVEPADVTYKVAIPNDPTIDKGLLSALQLESITYASQAHEQLLPDGNRAGFLIGDGAGVGKGRTIAGIIFENYLRGRKKAIWISVSNDLKYDAERDLRDIGASNIVVYPLNKLKYAKINSTVNGNVKKGVIFSTYSALISESTGNNNKYKSRLKQLLQWCGSDFDGCIVFDECHKAKNLCPTGSSKPTKTGLTALELQNRLPKARVVYASATGASEPRNMAYMVRLGLWGQGTPFATFNEFITAVEKRGVGAMEIVAMDMKLRGMYIARQLSFHGVTFNIEEVPLSGSFRKSYDESVELWVEAMQKFTEAAELIDAESRMKKTMWGQFWSAHQRFFKYLCIASKVEHAVKVARESIKMGKCVVIGLQSTGEARTLEQLEREDGELSDFVSTAKGVFQSLVEKHFPAPDRNRINRLLGLDVTKKTVLQTILDEKKTAASSSGSKRKQSTVQLSGRKRKKRNNSDEVSGGEFSDDANDMSDDSDFKNNTDSESEDDDEEPDDEQYDSNQSDDFNPFGGGDDSDSDTDPWVARSKKTKPVKKTNAQPKKKPQSTQDKIQELITKKQTVKAATASSSTNSVQPTPIGIGTNGFQMNYGPPPKDAIERACELKEELLKKIEKLGDRLPPNTLDQLIDELGGPENVAEMTGRKGRVIQTEDGQIQYESRSEQDIPLETLNLTEKQRFMDGEKDVAIISEAASSGISLQSDRRVRNQRRRVHITLELPWSADRAIQQFGRTHRSNQVNAPEYKFLVSDIAGERRFASTVAKRLESLGALTHGDRRATETRDLSQFNIDNKYGRSALESIMKSIMGYEQPLVQPPKDYKGDFFKDIAGALVGVGFIVNSEATPGVLSLDKDYNNISKFLNRILGMPVELQNRLFKYFTDTLNATISSAKKSGRFDLGILDLGKSESVNRIKLIRFLRKHATGVSPIELHTVHVERGMIWQEAIDIWADLSSEKEGFYLSHQNRNGKQTPVLAVMIDNERSGGSSSSSKKKSDKSPSKKDVMFKIYRPNTGLQFRHESLAEIEKKYKKVQSDEAEPHWNQLYDSSVQTCSHAYWRGNCRNVSSGVECEVGLRRRTYTVLSGSVLAVWQRVETQLAARVSSNNRMQVIRLKTSDGNKIVGILVPKICVESLIADLKRDAEKVEEKTFTY